MLFTKFKGNYKLHKTEGDVHMKINPKIPEPNISGEDRKNSQNNVTQNNVITIVTKGQLISE